MNIWFSEPKAGINCSYGPTSLYDNCLYWITKKLIKGDSALLKALKNIELPSRIGDALMECYLREEEVLDNKILEVFKDPAVSRLKKVNVRECKIENNENIIYLLNFNLRELHLEDCLFETGELKNFLHHLNQNGTHLEVFSCSRTMTGEIFSHAFEQTNGIYAFESWEYILQTPNLRKLILKNLNYFSLTAFIKKLLKPLKNLVYLDLSWAQGNAIDCSCLLELQHLQSLILQGANLNDNSFTSIAKLHNLQYLDLTSVISSDIPICSLVKNLLKLNFLDISETSIYVSGSELVEAFECRMNNPFQFFGAYNADFPSNFVIPAIITSNWDKNNYFNAMWRNLDNPCKLARILNRNIGDEYRQLWDNLTVELLDLACEILAKTPSSHLAFDVRNPPPDKGIIFAAGICWEALENSSSYDFMSSQMKKRVVTALVKRLKKNDLYGTITLTYEIFCLLSTKDLVYCMDVIMDFIEFIARKIREWLFFWEETLVVKHFFKIMNDDQKQRLINRGVIEDIVKSATTTGIVENIGIAWEVLFHLFVNSTSLLEYYGQRFLVGGGVELFVFSLMRDQESGLMDLFALCLFLNLAGCKSFAMHLIKEGNLLNILLELLNGNIAQAFDQNWVSLYNFLVGGIFVQILSHGIEIWTIEKLELKDIFKNLMFAIENFQKKPGMIRRQHYSIESVMQLLGKNHFPVIRYWAVRSIAAFYSAKEEINLLIQEGKKIDIFEEIAAIEYCPESVKKDCLYVIDKIKEQL